MFAYIIFTLLALMNVFTGPGFSEGLDRVRSLCRVLSLACGAFTDLGVFVDNAVQNSKKQRKVQLETWFPVQSHAGGDPGNQRLS